MLVLQVEPRSALLEKLGLLAGPEAILDLAIGGAERLAICTCDDDLLRTEPGFGERAQAGHQVDMRIARLIVINPVRDLSPRENLLEHELAHQSNVLVAAELDRERDDEFLGELRIGPLLEGLDLIPKGFDATGHRAVGDEYPRPVRCIGRQQELLVGEIALFRIVDCPRLRLVLHPRAMAIGRRQHGAAAIATGDELGREVRDGQGER